ncbi:hypothetical protein C8R44DRAFT_754461 [Mycena epipterygia]|nr:hypothetical protein C8R44DRAFT_754461 [Mycena epipterygia]
MSPDTVTMLVQLNSRFVVLPSIVLACSVSVQLTILAERREAVTIPVYFKFNSFLLFASRTVVLSCNMPKLSSTKVCRYMWNKLSTDAMPAFKTAAAAYALLEKVSTFFG